MSALEPWADALDEAARVLERASSVVLACHVEPDGDALGSMLALRRALAARGGEVQASWGRRAGQAGAPLVVPSRYAFLTGVEELVAPEVVAPAPDVFVALDCASASRLGSLAAVAERAGTVVVLDHHAEGSAFGDVRVVAPTASATAVLVTALLDRLRAPLDRAAAEALYVGLVTDTGRFSWPATRPEDLELAARLMRCGIDHAAIVRRVFLTHSFGFLALLGRVLQRARVHADGGIAWTTVGLDDLEACAVSGDEPEDVIDVLRTVDAVDATAVLREVAPQRWRVSLRSHGQGDVGAVAATLGGGGHRLAAGFDASGPPERIIEDVARLLTGPRVPVRTG